jgi:3-carboxy-cis,cis-muconate cycloisomerase
MRLDLSPSTLKFKSNNIAKLFDQESRWNSWLEVEAAMAIAQSQLGMIPKDVGKKIAKKCLLKKLNQNNIKKDLKKTGHKLMPIISELSRVCSKDSKKYVHWGGTTQNIVSTGDLLILKKIHKIFLKDLSEILDILGSLSLKNKSVLMVGRTHGQHALPITFGFKVASWIDEISRHIERILESENRVFRCIFGGATGTAASFGKYGMKLQEELAKKLELKSSKVPSRSHMDHFAEYVLNLIMISTTFGKISEEVYNLMKNEISELEEPITSEDIGSSTMPQKRNPHICQDIMALAAECRSLAPLTFESMMNEHEGSRQNHLMSNNALSQSCIKFGEILATSKYLLRGIKVKKSKMLQNLEMSKGSITSEAIMLKLGEKIGRQQAHKLIHDCYNYSFVNKKNFVNVIKNNIKIRKYLDLDTIDQLSNPNNYLGLSVSFAVQQGKNARKLSKQIYKNRL